MITKGDIIANNRNLRLTGDTIVTMEQGNAVQYSETQNRAFANRSDNQVKMSLHIF